MSADLKHHMLMRLVDGGNWMDRKELSANLSNCAPAIEDALSDLVIEGKAEYRHGSGYRLVGSLLERRAAQLLRRKRVRRFACADRATDGWRIGVAEMVPLPPSQELGLVMYEMTVPTPSTGQAFTDADQRQLEGLMQVLTRETERG